MNKLASDGPSDRSRDPSRVFEFYKDDDYCVKSAHTR